MNTPAVRLLPVCQWSRQRIPWRTATFVVPGLLLLSATGASAQRIERHFRVEPHPIVTIHNPNGTVTVRAWTKSDVMVVANRAADQVEVDLEQSGNRIDIMSHPVNEVATATHLRADYEISVP